ncbi:MAG: prepilin-type N-terminal cleavage/methylation domain-containing protein [Akkermansiaceae bacterium]|jgi:prepilin-type N-terminal cleavage/methylation domain-containing protein
MKTTKHTLKRKGFTLVELLVVIALIAALAGLAIVGVRKGMTAASAAKTAKNMKEIYNALSSLSTSGVDTGLHAPNTFPPAAGTLQNSQQTDFLWWDLVAEQLTFADIDGAGFEWTAPFNQTILQNPLSKKDLGGDKTTWDSLYNDPEFTHGSYAYNGDLGGDVSANADSESAEVIPQAIVEDEPRTIFFGEADDKSDTKGWIFNGTSDAPQGNYKDSAHCCFLDGSVKMIKNNILKDPSKLKFYSTVRDKNYSNEP